MKEYIAKESINGLSVVAGDVFTQNESGGYYCFKVDEEMSDKGVYKSSSYVTLPASIVEKDSAFELVEIPVLTKEEARLDCNEIAETPVEEVIKETKSDAKEAPLSTLFKVILDFPGAKEGDVYKFNSDRYSFVKQTPLDEDEYITGLLSNHIDELSVETVLENSDYFEDITPKVAKTKEQVMDKIADLAVQRMELDAEIVNGTNKLQINMAKKQGKMVDTAIKALEWAIGEGKDFIIE